MYFYMLREDESRDYYVNSYDDTVNIETTRTEMKLFMHEKYLTEQQWIDLVNNMKWTSRNGTAYRRLWYEVERELQAEGFKAVPVAVL